MVMLCEQIVEELSLIQLDHIEYFLSLLELLTNLQILAPALIGKTCLCSCNELLQQAHAWLTFAH